MYSEVDCYKLKTNSSYICTSIALPSFMGDRVELTCRFLTPSLTLLMWVRAGEGEVTDQFVILMGLTPIQKISPVVMV